MVSLKSYMQQGLTYTNIVFLFILIILLLFPVILRDRKLNGRHSTQFRVIDDHSEPPVIYLKFVSRLGNEIFEYASLYGIARAAGRPAVLVAPGKSGRLLKQLFPFLSIPFRQKMINNATKVKEKVPNTFDAKFLRALPDQDVVICCYLESWKYFANYNEELRREFTLNPKIKSSVDAYIKSITPRLPNNSSDKVNSLFTYIGVHVRRGDKARKRKGGFVVPNVTYFQRAAQYFSEKYQKVVFLVTSDDMQWCRKHLAFPDFIFAGGHSIVKDMMLLAVCNHTLVSVGTFGWWGAWLAGGDTVYFKDHVRKGTKVASWYRDEDYFMPQWSAIP